MSVVAPPRSAIGGKTWSLMDFALLGPLTVRDGTRQPVKVPGPRVKVLLATLLLHAGTAVSLDALAEAVWDERPPAGYATTLRTHVRRLRAALGPELGERIAAQGPGYVIDVAEAELDVLLFESLVLRTGDAAREAAWDEVAQHAAQALALWRATPLSDVPSQHLRDQVVSRLEQLRIQLLEHQAEADLHRHRYEQLVPRLRDLTHEYPLREHFHAQLMLSLARAGRRAEALAVYQDARSVLVEQLGIEPGPELRRLHESVLAGREDPQDPDPSAEPGGTSRTGRPVPRQLPATARYFIGRNAELESLHSLLEQSESPDGTMLVSAIDGMAGIGKTALAVHAAHRLADGFPDGQLFIDLHGHTEGHPPRSAVEALHSLLRALGGAPARLPSDVEELAAAYRHRLADTKTLIVLDNAVDETQIRPLIPGGRGCRVLVTSRRRLRGLYDAHVLSLDLLPTHEAVALLRSMVGPERTAHDDAALAEVAELCGMLPLALRIAAALLRHRPAWSAEHLADLLRDEKGRMTALADGDADVETVFDLSYRSLDARHRLLFRRLALIPGPDTDGYAVAALIDTHPADASRQLEHLVDQNLLISHAPRRYTLHDLLRLHAQTLAETEKDTEHDAAIERLDDYYEHTANRADAIVAIHPGRGPFGPAPAHAPAFAGEEAARVWLRLERPNLMAALGRAVAHGRVARQVGLTAGLGWVLRADGPWPNALGLHTAAAAVAERLGDDLGRADALIRLSLVRLGTGDLDGARKDLHVALDLYRQAADKLGQASALAFLGDISRMTGDNDDAMLYLEEAEACYQMLGNERGRASALVKRSHLRHLRADHDGTLRDLDAALGLSRSVGDQRGEATALTYLGLERRETGDFDEAARDFEVALALYRSTGERQGQAQVLTYSGESRALAGDDAGAVRELQQALTIYRALGERQGEVHALACLGAAERSRGDVPEALRLLRESLDLVRSIGARSNESWILLQYADAVAASGDHRQAMALYEEALESAEAMNQPANAAHAREGIDACRPHTGDTTTTGPDS